MERPAPPAGPADPDLAGEDDNNVPADATRWLAERIPGAERTVLADAGHGLGADPAAADEVIAEVFRWLIVPPGSPA